MRVLVIGNPIAGKGKAIPRIEEFAQVLERRGHQTEIFLTSGAGSASERARTIDSSLDRLVVAGGDGTVNEVLNGIPDPSRVPLLHFPLGTANQLALTLGLPTEIGLLANTLERGNILRADLGLAGNRRFLMLLTAGFDAAVTEEVKRHRSGGLGYIGYVVPIVKTIAQLKPARLKVILDEQTEVTGATVMLLKVRLYGGFLVFAEDARLNSGCFHVCVFREGSVSHIVSYALAGLTRTSSYHTDIMRFRARSVRIESDSCVPVEADGDHYGTTPVTVRLEPSVVPLITPG
jgi:YegS/Rv2252/BmrU family lipid kinase